jgi:hypothetical protein
MPGRAFVRVLSREGGRTLRSYLARTGKAWGRLLAWLTPERDVRYEASALIKSAIKSSALSIPTA